MELDSVEVGLDLVNFCMKSRKVLKPIEDLEPVGTTDEQPWRSQMLTIAEAECK
jgi:hypothetical protein